MNKNLIGKKDKEIRDSFVTKKQVIHIVANCFECGKEFSNYSNAKEIAMKHADMYGHYISGEMAIAFHYQGKKII